jgi:hypothetical protein
MRLILNAIIHFQRECRKFADHHVIASCIVFYHHHYHYTHHTRSQVKQCVDHPSLLLDFNLPNVIFSSVSGISAVCDTPHFCEIEGGLLTNKCTLSGICRLRAALSLFIIDATFHSKDLVLSPCWRPLQQSRHMVSIALAKATLR